MCRPFDSIRWMMLGLFWAAMARGAPASTDYNLPDEQSERAVDPGQMPTPPPCLLANESAGLLRVVGLPSVVVLTAPRDLPLWRTDTLNGVAEAVGSYPSSLLGGRSATGRISGVSIRGWCRRTNLSGFGVEFSDLTGTRGILPGTALRCLTLGGIGPDGKSFHKTVSVPARTLQAAWIGVDVPIQVLSQAILIKVIASSSASPACPSGSRARTPAATPDLTLRLEPIGAANAIRRGNGPPTSLAFGPGTRPALQSPCTATWPIHAETIGLRLTGEGTLALTDIPPFTFKVATGKISR